MYYKTLGASGACPHSELGHPIKACHAPLVWCVQCRKYIQHINSRYTLTSPSNMQLVNLTSQSRKHTGWTHSQPRCIVYIWCICVPYLPVFNIAELPVSLWYSHYEFRCDPHQTIRPLIGPGGEGGQREKQLRGN